MQRWAGRIVLASVVGAALWAVADVRDAANDGPEALKQTAVLAAKFADQDRRLDRIETKLDRILELMTHHH